MKSLERLEGSELDGANLELVAWGREPERKSVVMRVSRGRLYRRNLLKLSPALGRVVRAHGFSGQHVLVTPLKPEPKDGEPGAFRVEVFQEPVSRGMQEMKTLKYALEWLESRKLSTGGVVRSVVWGREHNRFGQSVEVVLRQGVHPRASMPQEIRWILEQRGLGEKHLEVSTAVPENLAGHLARKKIPWDWRITVFEKPVGYGNKSE